MSESVPPGPDQYNQDGLITIHNHDFMEPSTFKAAYQRGVKAAGTDYSWHWRVHIGLWAADEELAGGVMEKSQAAVDSGFYVVGSRSVRANFSEWKNIRIIEGAIPETLPEVAACQIAFCHIDMNCSPPEVAALSRIWDRPVPGARTGDEVRGAFLLKGLCLAAGDCKVAIGAYSSDHAICYALTDLVADFSVRSHFYTWGKFVHPCRSKTCHGN